MRQIRRTESAENLFVLAPAPSVAKFCECDLVSPWRVGLWPQLGHAQSRFAADTDRNLSA